MLPQPATMMRNVRLRSSLGPRGRGSAIKSLRKTLPVAGKLLGRCYLHHVAVILKIKLQRFFIMRLKNSLVQAEKLVIFSNFDLFLFPGGLATLQSVEFLGIHVF